MQTKQGGSKTIACGGLILQELFMKARGMMEDSRAFEVEKTCRECGAVFFIDKKKSREGRGLYCSRQCAGRGKAKKFLRQTPGDPEDIRHGCKDTVAWHRTKTGRNTPYGEDNKSKGEKDLHQRHSPPTRGAGPKKSCGRICGRKRQHRMLQESFSLEVCPWASGTLSPVRYDIDYYSSPDSLLGY